MIGRLGVHVISGGIGESIVVSLPSGGCGVIDSYATSVDDPASNPTISFLTERRISELEFVCLTHPHEDHYRGLRQVIEQFEVRYFWRFGAFSPLDLKRILLEHSLKSAKRDGQEHDFENATELARAYAAIARKKKKGLIEREIRISNVMPLYPLPIASEPMFDIIAIAPSTELNTRYEEDLAKCFDKHGRVSASFPRQRHNDVSVALILRYGLTRVVLGGDVEARGWREAQAMFGTDTLRAHGVKVSHHGSATGYTPDLWNHFSRDVRPYAVVTPFRRFGLPKDEALRHILDHGAVLLTTCSTATGGDFDFWESYDIETQTLMRQEFRSMHTNRRPDPVGICSLTFDDQGNCSYACTGAAAVVTARK